MAEDDPLLELLEAFEDELAAGRLHACAVLLDAAQKRATPDDPDVLYARACLTWEREGVAEAEALLQRLVTLEPTYADAHYALARAAEERGDEPAMIEHHLRVLSLDAKEDRETRRFGRDQVDRIEAIAREVLLGVPQPFAERLAHVPVMLERRPSRELVKSGFDPRALGLFEGPPDGDSATAAPTRIVLFTHNLLADFMEDMELSEQVEITLLHEIGHFFNLDEDDLARLGLD